MDIHDILNEINFLCGSIKKDIEKTEYSPLNFDSELEYNRAKLSLFKYIKKLKKHLNVIQKNEWKNKFFNRYNNYEWKHD